MGYRQGDPKWVTWSTSPHSEDEIREAVFHTPELICWSYVCRFSTLSEEFIEELIVLSTGLFDGESEDLYTEENINLIKDILFIEPTSARKERQSKIASVVYWRLTDTRIAKKIMKSSNPIRSRVDWYQIAGFQDLTPEFKNKFRMQFLKAKINSDTDSRWKKNRIE